MLTIGLVGLPNVGKSTLFNALTNANALVANYPFATIDPNVGIVDVIDGRLNELAKIYNSEKITPATLNITDIAGLVKGASKGEGLGNQFLSHIRSCQAIVQVVRVFEDDKITHVDQDYSPKKDIEIINTELILADLESLEKRIDKIGKEAKANPKLKDYLNEYLKAKEILNSGRPLWTTDDKFEFLNDLFLLTMKPILYVFNIDENNINNDQLKKELSLLVSPSPLILLCAKLEAELSGLDQYDKQELLESYGQKQPGLDTLTKYLYDLLGLQSFLTAGQKEVRAWTIKKGSTAPQAAGVIHSDFEKGFIAAEIVNYDDLLKAGSLNAARSAGKVRTEGKNYIVKDNDIIEFRFNI